MELVAAANLRSVNVVVHQLEAPKFEICADDNSATRTVHLSYPVWKSTSEFGYAIKLRRLKFEFHTGRTTARRTTTPCGGKTTIRPSPRRACRTSERRRPARRARSPPTSPKIDHRSP